MKGAAQFMMHWLIADTANGYLITNPSTSPENTIKIKGKEYQVGMATTMDMEHYSRIVYGGHKNKQCSEN